MGFKLVLMPPDFDAHWPDEIRNAVPDCSVKVFKSPDDLDDADAVFGSVPPVLFGRAKRLRWIAAARAGLGKSWFYDELVNSDVVVTGMHGAYNQHLSGQVMAFVLAFARRFDRYLPQQSAASWQKDWPMFDLRQMTAAVVGVGGSGAEVGRLCAAFGMRVLGFDPRRMDVPEGFEAVLRPEELDAHLGEADFVLITAPETPETIRMFNKERFARMKQGSYLVNVSRGALVVTDDLVEALSSGHLAGAGLDVMDPEPLPSGHPLWTMPGVLITPHVAINGTGYHQTWLEMLIGNCRRFARGEVLSNVVDKREWF